MEDQENKPKRPQPENRPEEQKSTESTQSDIEIASEWRELGKVKRREFPGPKNQDMPLRVAFDGRAYADLVGHAKVSLDLEICGVLVGSVYQDDEGLFVYVDAVIQGAAVRQDSAHVTFTQETWGHIHQTLEELYPKLKIVGWYHSHPGFGVEFSDMDIFIQENFFPMPTQVALVTDPLSGETSLMINGKDGPILLDRFWVEGREIRLHGRGRDGSGTTLADIGVVAEDMRAMEARMSQVLQLVEEQHRSLHRFLYYTGILVMLGVLCLVSLQFYSVLTDNRKPPELNSFAQVPVKIGDKTVYLGVGVVSWEVPEEINVLIIERERERERERIERERERESNQ